ncbi:MAG: response regulator [Polyangiaceae bacterium]
MHASTPSRLCGEETKIPRGKRATRLGTRRADCVLDVQAPPAELPRILCIDDERMVRDTLQRLLSRAYDVSTCADGREALDLLESGARFDVILCDNSMPSLSGPDLYELVTARWPDQGARFAFLCGSRIDPSSASAERPFFAKPFDIHDLRASVEGLLSFWGRAD